MNWFTLLSILISFLIGIILLPIAIPALRKLKFGQQIREEGPEAHLKKAGIPTMGGVVIVIGFIVATAIFLPFGLDALPTMIFTFLFALIGFLDDLLKIKKEQSEGLKAWQKIGLQIIFTVALIVYISQFTEGGTTTIIPFLGEVDLKGWFYPISIFAILGTVNGANFTDGLDGLASSVTIVISAFMFVAYFIINQKFDTASLAMLGALVAFLIYNHYPARIFMGDTGSLALGGFVAAEAYVLKMPIFLILVAFIYLVEIISVILQVGYFKLTHGKRIFRMAPIHHHYELGGWSEVKVVTVFSLVTFILCIVAFLGLYLI